MYCSFVDILTWIDLGPNKGLVRVSTESNGVYLVKLLADYWSGQQALSFLGWRNKKILRENILLFTNPTLLRISRTPAESQ